MRRNIVGNGMRSGPEPATKIRCACGKIMATLGPREQISALSGNITRVMVCASCGKNTTVRTKLDD